MASSLLMLKLRQKEDNGTLYEPTQTVLLNQKYILMSNFVLCVSVLLSFVLLCWVLGVVCKGVLVWCVCQVGVKLANYILDRREREILAGIVLRSKEAIKCIRK